MRQVIQEIVQYLNPKPLKGPFDPIPQKGPFSLLDEDFLNKNQGFVFLAHMIHWLESEINIDRERPLILENYILSNFKKFFEDNEALKEIFYLKNNELSYHPSISKEEKYEIRNFILTEYKQKGFITYKRGEKTI